MTLDEPETAAQRELVREGTTMTLYISMSLLAVLFVEPVTPQTDGAGMARTVLVVALGLMIAHLLAFAISSRLVNNGLLDPASLRLLAVQSAGGGLVAVVAALPILILGPDTGALVASVLLLGLVAVVGYYAARAADLPRWRALVYVGFVIAVTAIVIAVKSLGH